MPLPTFSPHLLAAACAASLVGIAAEPLALGQPRDAVAAEALFKAGRAAAIAGDHAAACSKFRESQRLDPAAGTLLNIADCEEHQGHTATAWQLYVELAQSLAKDDDRLPLARAKAASLEPRLARLVVRLAAGAPPATTVQRDGVALGPASLGTPLPADPGAHVVTTTAPGRAEKRFDVTLVEGRTVTLEVAPEPATTPTASAPTPVPAADRAQTRGTSSRSHARQIGAVVRADIDGNRGRGAVATTGLTYGLGDHVEITAAAMLGAHQGAYLGATGFLLSGPVKPALLLGVPLFFADGARPGVHAAGGVQWDPSAHFGVAVALGVEHFFTTPDGYQPTVFVPSVAVQGRL